RPCGGRCLLWYPLRRGAGRHGALDTTPTADSTHGHRLGRSTRTGLPPSWQHCASTPVRGLSLPECLRASNGHTTFEAAGLFLDPWWRTGHGNGRGLRPLGDGGGEQHHRGVNQLSTDSNVLARWT